MLWVANSSGEKKGNFPRLPARWIIQPFAVKNILRRRSVSGSVFPCVRFLNLPPARSHPVAHPTASRDTNQRRNILLDFVNLPIVDQARRRVMARKPLHVHKRIYPHVNLPTHPASDFNFARRPSRAIHEKARIDSPPLEIDPPVCATCARASPVSEKRVSRTATVRTRYRCLTCQHLWRESSAPDHRNCPACKSPNWAPVDILEHAQQLNTVPQGKRRFREREDAKARQKELPRLVGCGRGLPVTRDRPRYASGSSNMCARLPLR